MSLFHFQEWYATQVDEAHFITNASLISDRDQIAVGSLSGRLVIVDPGRDVERRNEVSILVDKQLPHAILQIIAGRFLASYDENLLAVLHPQLLVTLADEESYTLERIFEHRLAAFPAYNMCVGEFSRQFFSQLYIQSLHCTLSIYEGENHVLDRQLSVNLHPGPIAYATGPRCLFSASGGLLTCHLAHSFTAGVSGQQKCLNPDWTFNLGDTAIELVEMDVSPTQPSLLVLCRHVLYCFDYAGSLRFVIRLQTVATSLLAYKTTSDSVVQLCMGTAAKTLIFYRDSTMVWLAQLNQVPALLLLSSCGSTLPRMVTVLSDTGRLSIGYLGTEPALFRMPLTETRFIDFAQRRAEMDLFEQAIRGNTEYTMRTTVESPPPLMLSASIALDATPLTPDAFSTAVLTVKLHTQAQRVNLVLQSEVHAQPDCLALSEVLLSQPVLITLIVQQRPVRDARFRLVATTNTNDCALLDSNLPLRLLCQEVKAQRNAQIKLSLDCTGRSPSIAELYPEFDTENQSALGLQLHSSSAIVSIFSSSKSHRYRVQADTIEFMFLICDDLVRRLREIDPLSHLTCPIPVLQFTAAINTHIKASMFKVLVQVIQLEKRRAIELADMERVSVQMRHVETVLLNKLKAERDEMMTPTNVLINCTYRELLGSIDRLKATDEQLDRHRDEIIKPFLNLMHLSMHLNKVEMPFDGRTLNDSEQSLAQLLITLFDESNKDTSVKDIDEAELIRLLVSFCKLENRSDNIEEVAEKDELTAAEELTNLPGQELVTLESTLVSGSGSVLDLINQD